MARQRQRHAGLAVVSAAATVGATLVAVTSTASASVVQACGVPSSQTVAANDGEPSSVAVNVGVADPGLEPARRRPRPRERRRIGVGDVGGQGRGRALGHGHRRAGGHHRGVVDAGDATVTMADAVSPSGR